MGERVAFYGMLFSGVGVWASRKEEVKLLSVGVCLVCTLSLIFHILTDLTRPRS